MAREGYADAFYGEPGREFAHGHSYANNPMTSAAGIAVVDEILENNLAEKAVELGRYLGEKLESLKSLGIIREIRGKGLLRGVEFIDESTTGKRFDTGSKLGDALKKTSIENGLIMRINPDWFAVCPPLVADEADIDEMVDLIKKSLKDAQDLMAKS